ncbi:MAG: hypothetical protein ACXU9O_08790 [Gemmatimonadaceae bacterium]
MTLKTAGGDVESGLGTVLSTLGVKVLSGRLIVSGIGREAVSGGV